MAQCHWHPTSERALVAMNSCYVAMLAATVTSHGCTVYASEIYNLHAEKRMSYKIYWLFWENRRVGKPCSTIMGVSQRDYPRNSIDLHNESISN